jgi:hypothetical protein
VLQRILGAEVYHFLLALVVYHDRAELLGDDADWGVEDLAPVPRRMLDWK